MAIILLGSTVIGIRGTVDGITFSRNKGSLYARHWSRSSNPNTLAQSAQRRQPGDMARLWASLSTAQVDAWNDLAIADPEPRFNAFGEPIALSGFNYFTSLNVRRARRNAAPLADAPNGTDATRPPPPTMTLANYWGRTDTATPGTTGPITWDGTESPHTGDLWLVFGAYAPQPNARTPSIDLHYGHALDFSLGEGWISWITLFDHPAAPVGWRFFYRWFRERPSGIRSTPVDANSVLVPPPE